MVREMSLPGNSIKISQTTLYARIKIPKIKQSVKIVTKSPGLVIRSAMEEIGNEAIKPAGTAKAIALNVQAIKQRIFQMSMWSRCFLLLRLY